MRMIANRRILLTLTIVTVALILTCVSLTAPFQSSKLSREEQRGQEIYLKGTSPSGKGITAVIGDEGIEVPASALVCASCHGRDGVGRAEGGVFPSNLTWEYLTRPYPVTTPSGRKHLPYNETFLKRAIAMGLDPAGTRLQTAMPRFRMSLEDMSDLIAYLKRIGKILDPGLTETTITVGTIVRGEGPLWDVGQSVRSVLSAYFDELNREGGIFGRKVELRVITSSGEQDVKTALAGGEIFALVSPFMAGKEKELATLFEQEELPVVGPVTLLPQTGFPLNRHVFYLYSGLSQQVAAMCSFAKENLKSSRLAVVSPNNAVTYDLPAAVEEQSKRLDFTLTTIGRYSEGEFNARQLARQLRQTDSDAVFVFGSPEEQRQLIAEFDKLHWMPNVFLIGSLAGKDLFEMAAGFKGKIFVSYPTLPSDRAPAMIARFLALAQKHNLPTSHTTAQLSAYCAARILVEGLRLIGRDLSRERLVSALEGLRDFDTELTPRVTYGPNRRIGSLGAYIVAVDPEKKQLIPSGGWVPAN